MKIKITVFLRNLGRDHVGRGSYGRKDFWSGGSDPEGQYAFDI